MPTFWQPRTRSPTTWAVAGMRNHLAHRYFDTAHSIVQATVSDDLPPLVAAVQRLLDNLPDRPLA